MKEYTAEILKTEMARPFHPLDLEWRLAHSRMRGNEVESYAFAYVTNRAIMNRLDEVVGPLNWQSTAEQLRTVRTVNYKGDEKFFDGFLSSIAIRDLTTGEWVWKTDGADNSDMEPIKGGISGAGKRAGVVWGIGRYLYEMPDAAVVQHENALRNDKVRAGGNEVWINWSPPPIPDFALPDERFTFSHMQQFLIDNYKPTMESLVAHYGYGYRNLGWMMGVLKGVWGRDYYMTLAAYEAVYKYLST
jgi:hypothetical protein